jgi:hypothetical protein
MRRLILPLVLGCVLCGLLRAGNVFDPLLGEVRSDAAGSVSSGSTLATNLSAYLTSATAASTYATTASLSAYLTSATASSTYAPLTTTAALAARVTTAEQMAVDNRWQIMVNAGSPGQGWIAAWLWAGEPFSDWATHTNGYDGTGMASTVTPGTVDKTTGKTATISGGTENPGYPASNAIDDNAGTFFSGQITDSRHLVIDLGAAVFVEKYTLLSAGGNSPTAWTMQVSDDNTNWSTVDTRTGQSCTTVTTFTLSTAQTKRYWKMVPTETENGNDYYRTYEFELFGAVTAACTFKSVTTTASASPTTGQVMVYVKALEAITPNTDLIAKISENSHSTSTTVSLALLYSVGTYSIYYGSGDFPAGTGVDVGLELDTTAKGIEIYRAAIYWR